MTQTPQKLNIWERVQILDKYFKNVAFPFIFFKVIGDKLTIYYTEKELPQVKDEFKEYYSEKFECYLCFGFKVNIEALEPQLS